MGPALIILVTAGVFLWMWRDIKRRERAALLLKQQHEERERLEAMHRLPKAKMRPAPIPRKPHLIPIRGGRTKAVAKAPTRTGVIQADPPTISPAPPQAASPSSDDTAAVIGLVSLGVALYEAIENDRPSTAESCSNDSDNSSITSGGGGDFGGGGADSSWDSSSSSDSSSDSI